MFSKSAFMACMAAALRAEGRREEGDEQEEAQEATRTQWLERRAKEKRTVTPPPASGTPKERVLDDCEEGPRAATHFALYTDHRRSDRIADEGAADPRRDTDTLIWHPAHTTRASDTI